jgi:hypothetical protein
MNISDLNLGSHPYQTAETILLPYIKSKFAPDLMEQLHRRLIADDTLTTVFSGMPNAHDFSAWHGYLSKLPVVLYVRKPDTILGAGWLAQAEGTAGQRKGAFGFWFFRSAWGTQYVRDLCWLSLRWWFEEMDTVILYATSLKTNRLAVNFSRNFGFCKLCDLPLFFLQGQKLVDATLIVLKKTDFDPLYEKWRSGQQKPLKPFVNPHRNGVDLEP